MSITREIEKIRKSSLARNAGWMMLGQGCSLVLQAAYFILLARLLGVSEYGVFAGAFAFVGIVMPYSGIGTGTLFMRYVGLSSTNFAQYWGNILLSTFSVGSALAVLLYVLAPHFLSPASALVVLPIAIANCIFSQLVACIGQVFQCFEQLRVTAIFNTLVNLLRLVTIAIMTLMLHHASAWQWAVLSLVVSSVVAVSGSAIVTLRFGWPRFCLRILATRAAEGIGYSLGGSAQSIYNDIDKTMLSHYGMNIQNGIYTVAYRIIDIATIPITALDAAALPRYFRRSKEGISSITALAALLAKRAAGLGLLISLGAFITAPFIPRVIGWQFADSVAAVRWLCLLPAFRGVHQLTGSAIAGMGFQRYRTLTQFGAAFFNLLLNLWLIPLYSWRGAAYASLLTDGTLGISSVIILRVIGERYRTQAAERPETKTAV